MRSSSHDSETSTRTRSEPAHTGLSLSLRDFLARRLGFAAAERTTREIRRFLEGSKISEALTQSLATLLLQCDDVKFARLTVPPRTTEERLRKARQLAREIESELTPREPPGPPSGSTPPTDTAQPTNAMEAA